MTNSTASEGVNVCRVRNDSTKAKITDLEIHFLVRLELDSHFAITSTFVKRRLLE